MNVHEKLLTVQAELKAPKSQFNKFGNYAYRNAEDILEALKPLLLEVKATNTISDEIILVGERYYVVATAMFTDVETGESIKVSANAREEETKKGMDSSQITGSSSSYARKYALNGLYGIDDTKDADGTNKHDKEEEPQFITNDDMKIIKTVYERQGKLNDLLTARGINSLEKMPYKDAKELIETIKAKTKQTQE